MKIRSACSHSLLRKIRGAGILLPLLLVSAAIVPVQRASAQVVVNLYVGSNTPNNTTNFTSGTNRYDNTYVGYSNHAYNNLLTVSNTGTLLTNYSDLYVGDAGSGNKLVIGNGGTVANGWGFIGYDINSSNNSVLVTGEGSLWTNSGFLFVGYDGSSNSMVISSGGTVADAGGYIDRLAPSSSNNSVLVTGEGSLWTNSGDLYVGYSLTGNRMTISSGGKVTDSNGYVGYTSNAIGNMVTVEGSNSSWINSGDLYVGYGGQSNRLVITNGGFVSNVNGYDDGASPTDAFNSVLVTGTGSRWSNSGNLTFGLAGHDNSLVISNDGVVTVASNSVIGDQVNASNNSVLVTGAGSTWSNSGSLFVGKSGNGNSLVISNGGMVADQVGYIGYNSSSNTVMVTGSNSFWSNSAVLCVGNSGSSNNLIISNAGTVESSYTYIGYNDGANSNSVLVTGDGSLLAANQLDVSGGLNIGNSLTISAGGMVKSSSANIGQVGNTNLAIVSGAGSLWTNSGDINVGLQGSGNSLVISHGGIMSIGGNATVGEQSSGNRLSVLDGGHLNVLGDLNIGHYLDQTDNHVVVSGSDSVLNANQIYINTGNSSLVISNAGVVNAGSAFIGYGFVTNSSLLVAGSGSKLNVDGLVIAYYLDQVSSATVANGGAIVATSGIGLGRDGNSNTIGTLNIGAFGGSDTAGTIVTPNIACGGTNGETGVINFNQINAFTLSSDISGNGSVNQLGTGTTTLSGSNSYVGNTLVDRGRLVVTGLISNTANVIVGDASSDASLMVPKGGSVFTDTLTIGQKSSSSNNSVLVTDVSSSLVVTNRLFVGDYGSGNSLTISNGASVSVACFSNSDYLALGEHEGSGNTLTVVGASTLSVNVATNSLYGIWIGDSYNSSNNAMVVSGGAKVYSGGGSAVGYGNSSSMNNSILVTGTNSFWSNAGWIGVGYSGRSNSLTISNGASVSVVCATDSDYLSIGNDGPGNTLTVVGASTLSVNVATNSKYGIWIGDGTESSNNAMVVSGGAKVYSGGESAIGSTYYGTNNSVLITGAGSLWTNNGLLTIGGTSGEGILTVASGGTFAATNIIIASNSSTGTLNIGSFGGNDAAGTIISPIIAFGSGTSTINFNQIKAFALSSDISGYGSLNNLGTGTTTLSGSNSYTGETMITRGTLVAASTNALGFSDVTLGGTANAATLRLTTNLIITNAGPTTHYDLTWGSNGVIALAQGTHTLTIADHMTNAAGTNAGANAFQFLNTTLNNNTNVLINFRSSTNFTADSFSVQGIQGYSFELTPSHVASYIATNANIVLSTSITLNNTLTVASLTVAPVGSLSGIGTLNGNLTNSGAFTPGNAGTGTGVFTLNGNLTQTGTGVFILQASSGSQYNALQVNGSVLLGGTLVVTGANGYNLNYGDKFTFINSTGPIKGTFSSIETPEGFRARLQIIGDPQAVITIAPVSYTEMAQGQNQVQVATALNSFIPFTSGDQLVVSTSLDSLTASQYAQAFNAIMPTMYQSMATIAFNQANAQNMELNQRLWGLRLAEGGGFSMSGFGDNTAMIQEGQGDGAGDGKGVLDSKKDILRPGANNYWGMFVDANGIFANANSGNMLPGYNAESGGITAGLTYKWNDSFASGLYCGYQGTYAKMGASGSGLGTGSSLYDNAVRFGVFGTYGQKDAKGEALGFYGNALAGGAYHNYQATRVIQYTGMNRTANSSPGAGELDTMLSGGYDVRKGNFTFGPMASLQYTYLGVNGVNETGAQSLDFNSGGWNSSSMLSSVGAHAAYNWQAARNVVVVPQISLSWQHEFLQNPYDITGNLGGTSPNFSNTSATGIRDYLYTGVGFTVEFSKKWNTSFFYNAAAGNSDLTSQNIFWSAGLKF